MCENIPDKLSPFLIYNMNMHIIQDENMLRRKCTRGKEITFRHALPVLLRSHFDKSPKFKEIKIHYYSCAIIRAFLKKGELGGSHHFGDVTLKLC